MILDTNAISALADGDEMLDARIANVAIPSVPAIALGEFRFGISSSRRREAYESWLEKNLPDYHILPVDEHTASVYAELRRELKALGRPIPENDLWIAALARQHRLAVVTRDHHFAALPEIEMVTW